VRAVSYQERGEKSSGMIRLKNVSKNYSTTQALKNVSLHIRPGEFVSIVGQSGTGKTTLAKLLFAEERPTHGEVIIGDWDISRIKAHDVPLLRRQIGVVFQDFKLLPKKTVHENIAFALEVAGVGHRRISEIVPQVLKIVNLHDCAHRYPCQLSGGEQQRVAIARALAHKPKIIVADEPTGNLDTINTQEIINLLKKINEFGTTVVLVTHNREVVNHLKRRVITIHDGQILSDKEEGRYKL
jgi:cell division transport system ATP-binding protein